MEAKLRVASRQIGWPFQNWLAILKKKSLVTNVGIESKNEKLIRTKWLTIHPGINTECKLLTQINDYIYR